jgi:KUP system potassium uptake protein
MATLTLGALGVVFGDIGTSPLYALQALFTADGGAVHTSQSDVYGVISLVFWTITLVVSVKYVTFIMRADNNGEGGIMALIALIQSASPRRGRAVGILLVLGIFGASLFYGDGTITPAISVLSAIEGVKVVSPSLGSMVVPAAVTVLVLLFAIQRFGTGAIGKLFGPVMAVWFAVIGIAGLRQVIDHPDILRALSPTYGVAFFADHAGIAFVALASVVLTVTGAEALYADMGHFGRAPIRRAWFMVAFPALTLNYMGQGALIMDEPARLSNPFYLLIPHWGRIPMVLLATAATVIASQAVISGAFSITHQAVQLGFLPRLMIRHTSTRHVRQVYAPAVNWLLCVATAGLVVGFGSSAHLANAYGIAVTGTMALTTLLFLFVVRAIWKKPLWVAVACGAAFLTVDLALFSASLTKVSHGGWLPLAIAFAVFTVLTTWRTGRAIVRRNRTAQEGPLRAFVDEVRELDPPVARVPGTGVFLHADRDSTPLALRANVESNHVLHRSVVIVLIERLDVPYADPSGRVVVDDLGYRDDGITHVTARFGFRETVDVPSALEQAASQGREVQVDLAGAFYFLSRITIVPTRAPGMASWRMRLYVALARNEADLTQYYAMPDERTVTIGSVVEL